MPKIRFFPLGKTNDVFAGSTILSAANRCEAPIGQSCSGDGICGWCRVTVLEGSDRLAPPSELERRLMKAKGFRDDERAACLAKVAGDITVTTTYW